MNLKELVAYKLKRKFPEIEFEHSDYREQLSVSFNKKFIVKVASFLRDDEELQFKLCEDVTAVDSGQRKDRFTVVYHIFSLKLNSRLRLKVNLTGNNEPDWNVDSVVSVWKTADWHERETYDMYGIVFNNHPDLRRMYMPEDFEYYPLRKDFPLMGIPGSLSLPKKEE